MSPEAQRIAIARIIGITEINTVFWRGWKEGWCGGYEYKSFQVDVPNFPECLNAMHEAEKVLTHEQRATFGEHLLQMIPYGAKGVHRDIFNVAHASAAQRAEAFLRTLNLWDDSK